MANTFPEDEFDRLAAERSVHGAHRELRRAHPWLIALVLVLVLAPVGGIALGKVIGGNNSPAVAESANATPTEGAQSAEAPAGTEESTGADESAGTPGEAEASVSPSPSAQATATEQPAAEANMGHLVLVLNGRGTAGFASENRAILEDAGFGNTAVADYHGGSDPVNSTIFYSAPEYAGTAKAVAEALGVSEVVHDAALTGDLGAPVVAVIR